MTPLSALHHQAVTRPDHTAFIFGEDRWSYRRLAAASERLALALRARGVQQGDRVALHMTNVPELAVAYYACFRLGAIAAPLNTRLKTAELRPLLQRLRPVLYLGHAQLYPEIAAIEPDILASDARFVMGGAAEDSRAQPWSSLVESAGSGPILGAPGADLPAMLLATSGTTGEPKFVVHTPATLSAIVEAYAHFEFDGEQVGLNTMPMVHAGGISTLLACIRFGAPAILLERFNPDAMLDAIAAHRCSWLGGLPFMLADLLQRQQARARDVGSLRFCLTGGDVCSLELQNDFPKVFGVPLRSVWAASEAVGTLTYGLQPGPVSRIAPGAQVRLTDDAGAPVPRGQAGELLLRGPNVTVGYWTGPGRIEGLSQDGWIATGDLMRQGEGDDLWFVSRKKDLIIRGGSNISPVEVEAVLMAHPAVRDAAVTGVPDARLGQCVVTLVELAGEGGGAVLDDILASASAQLAGYKVPERLKAVDAIPKNALGKTDRKSLLAMV